MDFQLFLAMTPTEMQTVLPLPPSVAWLGCRFDAGGPGLSGLPWELPGGSLLVLTDEVAPQDHDIHTVAAQLRQAVEALDCFGVLLDWQRPYTGEAGQAAQYISSSLPCPVVSSAPYARELSGPVLVPPPAPWEKPEVLPTLWPGRELWLEATVQTGSWLLTGAGSCWEAQWQAGPEHLAKDYCTQVRVETGPQNARIHLRRGREELCDLAKKAGIDVAVGLYQEFRIEN